MNQIFLYAMLMWQQAQKPVVIPTSATVSMCNTEAERSLCDAQALADIPETLVRQGIVLGDNVCASQHDDNLTYIHVCTAADKSKFSVVHKRPY